MYFSLLKECVGDKAQPLKQYVLSYYIKSWLGYSQFDFAKVLRTCLSFTMWSTVGKIHNFASKQHHS